MMTILYNLFFIIFGIFYLPFFFARLRQADNSWKLIKDRCGFLSKELLNVVTGKPVIWVHAVSVGEVMSLRYFIRKLRDAFPTYECVFSTVTPTGQQTAISVCGKGENVFYFPFDLSFIVKRVISLIRPRIILLVETEIWPNFILAAYRQRIPIGVVNGRLSERSIKWYKRFPFLARQILSKISFICAQTEHDKDNFVKAGVKPESIRVTGNMKFDSALASDKTDLSAWDLRRNLGFSPEALILLAGSTHPGEEEIILSVFSRLRSSFPHLKLILAPRHIDRASNLKSMAEGMGFRVKCARSLPGDAPGGEFDVFILNTIGELKELYRIADSVFMGGSLVPHGGQNPIEPACFKRPIIFGPHVFNFSDIYERLESASAAEKITDTGSFYKAAAFYLSSREDAKKMGEKAFSIIQDLCGATDRNLEVIKKMRGSSLDIRHTKHVQPVSSMSNVEA